MKTSVAPRVEMRKADYIPQLDVLCHHFPSGHVIYLYHALGKGYYRKNKILPVFSRTNHSPDVIKALASGIFNVGTATAAELIIATSKFAAGGNKPKDFPVKMIYQADQNYSTALYSLSNAYRKKIGLPIYEKDITTPEDMIGKVVRTGGGTPSILFDVMMAKRGLNNKVNRSVEKNGIDRKKINQTWVEEWDVKTYSNLMLQGQLDVYSKPTFGHGQFLGRAKTQNKGLTHASFSTLDVGLPRIYGVGIVARKDFVLEHADMVKPFLRAIDKAMPECIKDPRFGVRVMNEARGFGRQYDEIEGIKTDITVGKHPEITGPGGFYTNEDTKKYGYGCIRKNKLRELIDLLDEAKLLPKKIKPEDVYMDVDFR